MRLLEEYISTVRELGMQIHSIHVEQDGQLLDEAFLVGDNLHILNSLSKIFTITAIGILYDQGRLRLEDRVIDFFPEECPAVVSDNLSKLQVRNLLTMTSGHRLAILFEHQRPFIQEKNWAKYYLSIPFELPPGQFFVYDGGDTYMLSNIVQEITGQTTAVFLKEHFFDRVGITEYRWDVCPRGVTLGANGLYLHGRDILKLGEVYRNHGVYRQERILSEDFTSQAISPQISIPPAASTVGTAYGYHFTDQGNGVWAAAGAQGQLCILCPDKRLNISCTANVPDMNLQMYYIKRLVIDRL